MTPWRHQSLEDSPGHFRRVFGTCKRINTDQSAGILKISRYNEHNLMAEKRCSECSRWTWSDRKLFQSTPNHWVVRTCRCVAIYVALGSLWKCPRSCQGSVWNLKATLTLKDTESASKYMKVHQITALPCAFFFCEGESPSPSASLCALLCHVVPKEN